jgi:hypothetical protein
MGVFDGGGKSTIKLELGERVRYHALKWDTQQLTSEVSKKKLV